MDSRLILAPRFILPCCANNSAVALGGGGITLGVTGAAASEDTGTPGIGFGAGTTEAGVAPHENPPVEKSLLGTAYDTAHALGETAQRFGEGIMGTFRMVTGGEPKQPGFDPLGDIKSLGSAIVDPIKQHFFQDPDATITQRVVNTAFGLMGGDVEGAAKGYEETGNILPAMIRKAGVPVVGILAGIGLSALKKPVTATLDSTNAAISLIDPKAMRPMFDPLRASGISPLHMPADVDVMTGAATLTMPLKQQALRELGYEPTIFASGEGVRGASDVMGAVKRGGKAALDVVDRAVDIAQRPIDATIKLYETQRVPQVQQSIIAKLMAEADNFTGIDDAYANALRTTAENVAQKGNTVGELNALKVHANKEIGNLIRGTQSQQMQASAQASYAYHTLADAIRHNLYPEVERMGGVKLSEYGAREAAAIMERDGVSSTYYSKVLPEHANEAVRGYFDKLLHGSLYKSHVARRALGMETVPMAEFNKRFLQGIGDIGTGFVPETISGTIQPGMPGRVPVSRQLPSASGGQFQFSIPNEGVFQSLPELSVSDSIKIYQGTADVPYGRNTPLGPKPPTEGTSHFRQRQQLGVAAETIPESVRGRMTPAKTRADQLGSSQSVIPERSFTGPESTTESRWTYAEPTRELSRPELSGPGILRTSDPAVAVKTLADITTQLKNPNLPANLRNQLTSAQATLQNQLQQYYAYSNVQAPPSVKLNVSPAKLGTKRSGKPIRKIAATTLGTGMLENREKQ